MTHPEDEPLDEWAARREQRRAEQREIIGTRRVLPLTEGPRASHVAPNSPRLLQEWDGTAWGAVGIAQNAEEARAFLGHASQPAPESDVEGRTAAHPDLGPGRGRHRKP